ncbi:hypothetical protein AB6813_01520 [bacterium RCC_150]
MNTGEKLLALTVEYQNVIAANALYPEHADKGRSPSEIGDEYAATLRELLS